MSETPNKNIPIIIGSLILLVVIGYLFLKNMTQVDQQIEMINPSSQGNIGRYSESDAMHGGLKVEGQPQTEVIVDATAEIIEPLESAEEKQAEPPETIVNATSFDEEPLVEKEKVNAPERAVDVTSTAMVPQKLSKTRQLEEMAIEDFLELNSP